LADTNNPTLEPKITTILQYTEPAL